MTFKTFVLSFWKIILMLVFLSSSFLLMINKNNQIIDNQYFSRKICSKNYQNNYKKTKTTQKWIDTIKESAKNNFVKLFFTRNASLAFEQGMIATNYMLQYKNGVANNDIVWFVDYDIYDSNHYNFEYFRKYNNANDKFKIVSRLSDISNQNQKDELYRVIPSDRMIGAILDYYLEKDVNTRFDIWVPDASFTSIWTNSTKHQSVSNFYKLFQKTNKINILSDGNYQNFRIITTLLERLNKPKYKQLSIEEMREKINLYKNDQNYKYYSDFRNYDFYDFIHYGDLFTIFHIKSYTDSPYYKYPSDKVLYKVYDIDYDYVSMGNKLFPNLDETSNKKRQNFITDFEIFFNIQNSNSLQDFVWKNIEAYDPKKKNLIWLGDSLLRIKNDVKKYEINKIVDSYLVEFPKEEYNYFIKHHPSFNFVDQEKTTNWIFENKLEPIYMKSFPWELFLSWDYKQSITNNDYKSFFIMDDTNNIKTKLIGLQYTTTTILTTAFYLTNTHEYELDQISDIVSISNFPIPITYDIISKTEPTLSVNPSVRYQKNLEKIHKIYDPFIELNLFPSLNDAIPSNEFIEKNQIDFNLWIVVNTMVQKLLVKVLILTIIILVIIEIPYIVLIINNKKNRTIKLKK